MFPVSYPTDSSSERQLKKHDSNTTTAEITFYTRNPKKQYRIYMFVLAAVARQGPRLWRDFLLSLSPTPLPRMGEGFESGSPMKVALLCMERGLKVADMTRR